MRRSPAVARVLALALALAGQAAIPGGAHAQPAYPPMPPPRAQMPPPPLGPHQAWVPGHWHWNGMRYVWIRPHPVWRGAGWYRWSRGQWVWAPRRGHWVWRPAHWR